MKLKGRKNMKVSVNLTKLRAIMSKWLIDFHNPKKILNTRKNKCYPSIEFLGETRIIKIITIIIIIRAGTSLTSSWFSFS